MHILPIIAIIMSATSSTIIVRPFGSTFVRRPEEGTANPLLPLVWLGAPEEAQHRLTDTPTTLLTAWFGEPDQQSGAGKRSLDHEAVTTPEIQKIKRCRPDECPGAPLRAVSCSRPKDDIVRRLW